MAKKRRYVHRRDAQPNILQAAIELFGRDGRNVTTRALAKAAQTHGPLLYTWFQNKENLYLQAVTHAVNQANRGFTDFALKVFGGSEQPSAAQIAEGLRSWYSAIPPFREPRRGCCCKFSLTTICARAQRTKRWIN